MSASDTLPSGPDYGTELAIAENAVRDRLDGGFEYVRSAGAPPQRQWQLVWEALSWADYLTLEAFWRRMLANDWFIWTDPSRSSRKFAVQFAGPLSARLPGYNKQPAAVLVREAVGRALAEAGDYSTVLIAGLLAEARTLGNSVVIIYGGYGYKLTCADSSDVLLDGVSTTNDKEKYDVPLGLHKLEIQKEGSPPTVSAWWYVW
jgi:phage-related protein